MAKPKTLVIVIEGKSDKVRVHIKGMTNPYPVLLTEGELNLLLRAIGEEVLNWDIVARP